jgi:hypothetical protein
MSPEIRRLPFHRYTITSEGASKGYFRLVEDPEGAWVTWAEVEAALAGQEEPPHSAPPETLAKAPDGEDRIEVSRKSSAAEPPHVTLGVGTGDTGLFVHGPYDAIKRVQSMIFELERLRAGQEEPPAPPVLALVEQWREEADAEPAQPRRGQTVLFVDYLRLREVTHHALDQLEAALKAAPPVEQERQEGRRESIEDWVVREARLIAGPRTHLHDSEALIQFGLRVAAYVASPSVVSAPPSPAPAPPPDRSHTPHTSDRRS